MRERHRGHVIDYTHEGKGIVKVDGLPIFIDEVVVGDHIEFEVTKNNKTYGFGRLTQLIKKSDNHVTPACPFYGDCGGCQIQHLSYPEQLRFKQAKVTRLMQTLGVPLDRIAPIKGMDDPYHYRNKVQVPFGMTYDGKVIAGFYAPKSHDIIDMDECLIENADADAILQTVRLLVNELHIEPYDSSAHSGCLRHVLIRKGQQTGQVMVVFITKTPTLPNQPLLIKKLLKAHPLITTIIHNHNPQVTNVILGEREQVLFGPGYIEDILSGMRFKIAAKSFFQVNAVQTEVLYQTAIDFASIQPTDEVLDAYCGVGTIGMLAAKQAKFVEGVEVIPAAIVNAKTNAHLNHMHNIEFHVGDAGQFLVQQQRHGKLYDVVFVDPPRQGLDESFIHTLLKILPNRIVYVSCDPSTLTRDLRTLSHKYEINKVQAVDMFAQTHHVETCVLLTRK